MYIGTVGVLYCDNVLMYMYMYIGTLGVLYCDIMLMYMYIVYFLLYVYLLN